MLRSDGNGEVKAVQTFKNTLYSKKAVIVATGCWTGGLIQDLFRNWGMELHVPVRPRKVRLCIQLEDGLFFAYIGIHSLFFRILSFTMMHSSTFYSVI